MESVKSYGSAVGIDVCAERLDWHRLPEGSSGANANTPDGIKTLVTNLKGAAVDIIVIEATGGLQRQVATALAAAGIAVVVVNPRQVRALPDEAALALRDKLARRGQWVEMRAAEKNRRWRASARIKRSIDPHLAFLDRAIKTLDQYLDNTLRGSPAWAEQVTLIEAVTGVGPQTVRRLLIELPELGKLNRHASPNWWAWPHLTGIRARSEASA